ncbi:Fungal specific transcription factor domain containing protein [Hyaloscypha variabilis]
MAGGSRSRLGCWTCRLRRKKCDERRPECATCEGLGIACHGYGQRPEWMDGGEKEKAAAAETRRQIKSAARREPPAPPIQDRSNRDHSNARSPRQSPVLDGNTPLEQDLANVLLHEPSQADVTSSPGTAPASPALKRTKTELRPGPAISFATLSRNQNFNGFDGTFTSSETPRPVDYSLPQALKGREASLLMYYLDYVFPIQFRMYNPTAAEGGRGWLLSLLLRTPPMYHMTLAMSAHCFEMIEVPNGAKERKQASLSQLGSALQNLQQYIRVYSQQKETRSMDDSLKVLGCILQMTAFVAFAGGTENWHIHMKGAADVLSGLVNALIPSAPLPETASSPPSSVSSHDSDPSLFFNEDEVLLKFLVTVFVWIDTVSCVSLGSRPFLADHHETLLGGPNPPLRLDKIAGIRNWALISIGKIASLDAWKRNSQSNGTLSIIELAKRATKLEIELKQAFDEFMKNRKQPTIRDRPALPYLTPLSEHADYVSEFYGRAALTYLHVVVSGPYPELPEIRENIFTTMELLKRLPNTLLPRTMWWPLLITGSLAGLEEQTMIRNIILKCGVSESSLGIGWNILIVLEECWKRRSLNDPVAPLGVGDGYWGDIMTSLHFKLMLM